MDRPIYPISKESQTRRENKKAGKSPRQAGNRVERLVAKTTGGQRVPMSGAIKNTNKNLEGDVDIPDADGKPLVKLEVKMREPAVTTRGEKTIAFPISVLDQMTKEAEANNEVGGLWIHVKGRALEEGYLVMSARHWLRFLEYAKVGAAAEK